MSSYCRISFHTVECVYFAVKLQENREKQMNLLRDRIARIQNEKTMTGALSRKCMGIL